MLIYIVWQLGVATNQEIGEKFGLTYSAVSQRVSIIKGLLIKNQALRNKFIQIKSQMKIWTLYFLSKAQILANQDGYRIY